MNSFNICLHTKGARPKKAKGERDPYCRLAEAVGNMERAHQQQSAEPSQTEVPPAWFQYYMDKVSCCTCRMPLIYVQFTCCYVNMVVIQKNELAPMANCLE